MADVSTARPVLPGLTHLNRTKKYGCLLPTEVRCVNQLENERQAETDCRRSVTGQEMQDTIKVDGILHAGFDEYRNKKPPKATPTEEERKEVIDI